MTANFHHRLLHRVDHRLGLVVVDVMAAVRHHRVAAAGGECGQPVMSGLPGLIDRGILFRRDAGKIPARAPGQHDQGFVAEVGGSVARILATEPSR